MADAELELDDEREDDPSTRTRTTAIGIALILFGLIGLWAALSLMIEAVQYYKHPDQSLACDFSVLVSCSHNIASSYGSLFGFPNPILGLMAWPIVITTGALLVGKVPLPAWYWRGFSIGCALALLLVAAFVSFSMWSLQVLCPWCMLTWSVTIPTFWTVVLHAGRQGYLFRSPAFTRFCARCFGWIPSLTVACYLIVIVLAQLNLDAIPRILHDLMG